MKEIQSLIGRAIALSLFFSRSIDKYKPFFSTIKKIKGLLWTDKCEGAFTKLKEYLSNPSLLSKPIDGEDLYLYMVVSDCAISLTLIQEKSREQKPTYYVPKTLIDVIPKNRKSHPHIGNSSQKTSTILLIIHSSPNAEVSITIHSAEP